MLSSLSESYSEVITAEGYGETEAEARGNAAAELSFVIYSDIRSALHTDISNDPSAPKQIVTKQIDITSAIPVYGASYTIEKTDRDFHVTAELRPEKAIPIYRVELEQSVNQINKINKLLYGERSSSVKYSLVMSALSNYENMLKVRAVLNVLGGPVKRYTDVTLEQLKQLKQELTEKSDSMSHVAELIASELKRSRVYVYYPMFTGSEEVTQFSAVFREMLAKGFKSVGSVFDADYFLETIYTDAQDGIYVSATLFDKKGITLGKSVKLLEAKAHKGLNTKPKSLSFERLLKLGLVQSSDFKVRLATNNGKKAMLYRSGDSVELFVKMNKPGYFFMVGHVYKDGQLFSYLVDFYNTKGNRKFIRKVDVDEINRWISIGEFDIVPQFGLETFQIIAVMKDPVDMIPSYVFDTDTELYIVSKDIKEGVTKSRALKLRPENLNASAEDVLIFSTIEK
ncbi:MAG: hypothetical protein C0602_12195 [Denitrovibrio sp.]|nr:MAG: hypothetical protein C0602_12195 [Denitrovibrio sp.]